MKTVSFSLTSMPGSPLFFGKPVFEARRSDETHAQLDDRTWRQKVATNDRGQVLIQPFALKNCLESAARRLQMKVPSLKGTFTKLFTQGILVTDEILLFGRNKKPVTIDDVSPLRLFVPSDGKRGSGKRVERIFPELREWQGKATIYVLDNKITDEVLRTHLTEAGKFIGFGSMRCENGGINGRFEVA